MYIVAGLPLPLHNEARSIVKRLTGTQSQVIALASGRRDGPLYAPALVSAILRAVSGFAVRRRSKGPQRPPVPASILLLYVPAPDDEAFLKELDFTVFPASLLELAALDSQRRQLRHSIEAVEAALRRTLTAAETVMQGLAGIMQRINARSDREPLLLPPRNFHVSAEHRLADLFSQLRRGER
jgi:hypothetical protein